MSRSDLIGLGLLGAIWAFGLLPLSDFGLLSLLSFYRFWAFGLLSIVYVISYFGLSVYVVLYVSDFILYYGIQAWMLTFKYLYMDISDICTYRIIFTISKVTGVTFWYQSGFRPGSDPGWRFLETWFYSVLTVLNDFKIFSGIWEL